MTLESLLEQYDYAGFMPHSKPSISLHTSQYQQFIENSRHAQWSNVSFNIMKCLHDTLHLHTSDIDFTYMFGNEQHVLDTCC